MSTDVKRMADLLRSGATMLSEICPVCATPLFRRGKDTFCAKCNRPVAILKSAEDEVRLASLQVLDTLEQTILGKISELNAAVKNELEPSRFLNLGETLKTWLAVLEQVRKLKSG